MKTMPVALRMDPPRESPDATFSHVRARAEWMAWAASEDYARGAMSRDCSRLDRAEMWRKARDYQRRAERVTAWKNGRA